MSMTTGDFVILYSSARYQSSFDAVTTVFFIDTAPNLLRYIEAVHACLRPGGVWTNVGPLLWHFESRDPGHGDETDDDAGDEDRGIASRGSFELAQDEIVELLVRCGFDFVKHDVDVGRTGYIQDPHSMLQNLYKPVHWVVRKR